MMFKNPQSTTYYGMTRGSESQKHIRLDRLRANTPKEATVLFFLVPLGEMDVGSGVAGVLKGMKQSAHLLTPFLSPSFFSPVLSDTFPLTLSCSLHVSCMS